MKQGRRVRIKIWIFVAIFLPLTSSLGLWQLDRADQKRHLLKEQHEASEKEAERFDASQSSSIQRYQRFIAHGQYDDGLFFLDNRQRHGVPGYEVLSLFYLEDGGGLIVNRGWVRAPKYRSDFPRFETPTEKRTIEGYFYWPDKPLPILKPDENIEALASGVTRLQRIDWELLNEYADVSIQNKEFRINGEDIDGAFDTNWAYSAIKPEKHMGYAFQWFSLATALLVLAAWASYRLREE